MEFPRDDSPEDLDGDLEFQVVDWYIPENDKSKQQREQAFRREHGWVRPEAPRAPLEYEIFMFGVTSEGHTVTTKVTGFRPYFFVKVPESWKGREKARLADLNELMFQEVDMVNFKGEKYKQPPIKRSLVNHLVDLKIVKRKDFWGFSNGTDFKFIQVTVKSLRLFNDLRRFFGDATRTQQGFKLYESNIDPFLRFIHERYIQPCGWVRIPSGMYKQLDAEEEKEKQEKQTQEIIDAVSEHRYREWLPDSTCCNARTSYCVEAKYSDVYGLQYNKIAPLLIASFDIECTSSHGDFPVAIKDYRKLTIDLIAAARSHPEVITRDTVMNAIADAFMTDIPVDKINKLYPKKRIADRSGIISKLEPIIDEIILKVKSIAKATPKSRRVADDSDDSDKEIDGLPDGIPLEPVAPTVFPKGQAQLLETQLTALLTSKLPGLKGDEIIQIGTTVHRYGSDEIVFRHITTLKSCTDIDGTLVEPKETEEDVLMAWKSIIDMLDPDIIIGYNIFGFDMKYIADRARELGIYEQFVYGLGRLRDRHCDILEKKLSSSALGDNIMYCFDMDGVVQIDMLKVMQRDHKLDSYKLDSVAGKFIVDSGIVVASNQIKLANTHGLREGNYIRVEHNVSKLRICSVDDASQIITIVGAADFTVNEKVTWGLVKDDITPNEIFAKFRGNARDRMEIAKYCLQDCELVNRLLHKLKVLENNVGMGNVCYVPLSYLFMRGQGIKIFSLVSRECRMKKHLIPVIKTARDVLDEEIIGYEGAIVLPPQEGIYLDDPIVTLDYASLYPSSMISRNISHDAFVLPGTSAAVMEEAKQHGISFQEISFDEYEGTGDKKRVVGQRVCVFAQLADDKKGIIPSILQMLLKQRKNTRKKIEYETVTLADGREFVGLIKDLDDGIAVTDVDSGELTKLLGVSMTQRRDTYNEFEKAVLDARQLAYKVTANSLYGQTGSRTSPIYLKEVAACTTATGREMIITAKQFVETKYGAEVVYGDSVMPYTPVLLRNKSTNEITIKTIADLGDTWTAYDAFKAGDSNRREKQQSATGDYQIWTHMGWSDIVRVIRHKCGKSIYRVLTHTGLVDVTEDHSLLDENANILKPTQVQVGTRLLHSFPDVKDKVVRSLRHDDLMFDRIDADNQVAAQRCFTLLKSRGYNVTISDDMYITWCDDAVQVPMVTRIEKLHDAYDGYVYDIETEIGVFQAGVGDIVVKNTDSIFCRFPVSGKKGMEALPMAIAAGQVAAKEIKKYLPPPQDLEYEKTFWPFILFSKKRYVGNLYETDHTKKPKQKSMGIVLKRRDNAPIVKKVYGGVIDILMNKGDLSEAVGFLKSSLQDLVDGKVPMNELIISKTLKGDYKDPTKIAHKVLADRMGERDPGNKPMVNDRLPFIYICAPEAKLQGDRIEHPDYISVHPEIKPDYNFYITNQLMKPITQLFALCVTEIDGYSLPPNYWQQIDIELEGTVMYADAKKRKTRITNMQMKEAKELLFDPFIAGSKPNTPARPRGKRLTAAQQAIQLLDRDANGHHIMDIQCVEKKRGSLYDCKVIITHTSDKETIVFELTKSLKGKKVPTLRMIAMEAVNQIVNTDDLNKVRDSAVLVTCADKTFMRLWKAALKDSHEPSVAGLKNAKDKLDDELLQEQCLVNSFQGLATARSVLKYILQ